MDHYLRQHRTKHSPRLTDMHDKMAEQYKRNRPVFAINIFTDTKKEMISFRNEKGT